MDFNIFKILEKDNKELIHSSFIKFLIEEDQEFFSKFLKIKYNEKSEVSLEKSYKNPNKSKTKNNRCRFDIEIKDDKRIIIIENKFKSFPNDNQLIEYNKSLKFNYPNHEYLKFLLYFDKNLFKTKTDWKILDYKDFVDYLKNYKNLIKNKEKIFFVNQYYIFLKEYIEKYQLILKSANTIFSNQKDNENKFWIKLFYSNLEIQLTKYFKENNLEVNVYIASGNKSIPLLNIVPSNWNTNKIELLIQIQNGELKFYAHTKNKEFLKNLIDFSKQNIDNEFTEFKNINNINEKTSYIFKIKFFNNKKIKETTELDINKMYEYILKFYNKIDTKIIKNYS
ncbi:PD-(D/E)XK nuclease family protein [Flavobacterium sp. 14A]|uniref:PD-(D/E)XK nuclease family protein n=1 Tax=Flavobacterium sp. 14A TaxID=2735896 RepID=UPI00156DBD7B|nr:PD-(D/E)XK nuclease family protein [Flavobacterium sp. 14A]NRT13602.1 hypothetical protein [Flavobacterium sp. 14A]